MSDPKIQHPEAIVSGEWLERHLSEPELRIFDCTTYLIYEEGTGRPYRVESGSADHQRDHIPGAGFLDLQQDFSVADSPCSFTLPSAETAADAFARHGIGNDNRVIFYSRKSMMWATRFWWMLRWLGFDRAAILDGGYDKWRADGRPVSSEPCTYAEAKLTINPRPDLFVDRHVVQAAMGDKGVCTINALSPDLFSGENARYGRPGRIPGSINVPALSLLNPDTLELLPADALEQRLDGAGVETTDGRKIVYCGGGIAATLDAFVLHQLGHRHIAVYDNSMSEWATDDTLSIETD